MAFADLFKNIDLKNIKLFGSRGGGSVLGVDISSSSIKLAQLRSKRGQALLETYGTLALGPYANLEPGKAVNLSTDQMAEAIKDLMREAKVSTKSAGMSIPLSASLIHVIEMPDVGESKLKEMVPIEIRKYIPVPVSEVLLDWRIIPGEGVADEHHDRDIKGKKAVVLTVAIHRDTISRYQEIARKAGLSVSFFEIEVFSTMRSVIADGLATQMIVDFGSANTKVFVVDRRVLRESHTIGKGMQDVSQALAQSMSISLEKAEELKRTVGLSPEDKTVSDVISLVIDSIIADAGRTMLAYQKRYNKNISVIHVVGGGSNLIGLTQRMQEKLQTEVAVGNPFTKLETPAFLEDTLSQVGPEFTVSVGIALRKLAEAQ